MFYLSRTVSLLLHRVDGVIFLFCVLLFFLTNCFIVLLEFHNERPELGKRQGNSTEVDPTDICSHHWGTCVVSPRETGHIVLIYALKNGMRTDFSYRVWHEHKCCDTTVGDLITEMSTKLLMHL